MMLSLSVKVKSVYQHSYNEYDLCTQCKKARTIIEREELECQPLEVIELVRGGPGDGRIYTVEEGLLYYKFSDDSRFVHMYKRSYRTTVNGTPAFEYLGFESKMHRID